MMEVRNVIKLEYHSRLQSSLCCPPLPEPSTGDISMFTRPSPWLPPFILCLLFASPVLSDHPPPPPTTQYDPFHAIAALAPKPSEEPICCLKPLTPLEPVDDDLFLSFEDWKSKRFSESSSNNQKSNGPPNTSTPTRGPPEGHTEAAPAHPSISFDTTPGYAPDSMDATLLEGSVGGSTTPMPPPPPPLVSASPHFRVPLTDRFNYASLDCSARVHTAHGAAKSAASILSSQRDRYMLSPCGAKPQFVVVELCEDIRIDTVQLANFEFFSGVFKEFTVSVAKTYAAADAEGWTVVGTYVGKNVRGVQVSLDSDWFLTVRLKEMFSSSFQSRSTRRRPFVTFTGTFESIFTRITPTSITARSRCFAFMVSPISSSGSGILGRKKAERA